jgi:peptidoglycan/xylan/chitin deacetylase (PgdA/CDA1 family)
VIGALKQRLYRQVARAWGAAVKPPRRGLRVLTYHAVGLALERDPYGNSISKERFAEHVRLLASLRVPWPPARFGPAGSEPALCVTFDDGFRDTLTEAAPLLVETGIPFMLFATADFIRRGEAPYLDAGQLRALAALPGASIGSHGLTHKVLTTLSDADLAEELSASRRWLEDLLGRPVESLSYPHGAVDRRVRDAAEAAGYRLGATSRWGANEPERDPLLLCRTEVTAWDTAQDLRAKIDGHWDWYAIRHPDPQAA